MPSCGTWERLSAVNAVNDLEEKIRCRIAQISEAAPDSIGDMMQFRLLDSDVEKEDFVMSCKTAPWMRNFAGTLHGGLCATILDQAMGFVSYCLKPGEGTAPTVQLEVDYHRPINPGEDVIVKVHVVSATRSLMNLTAEAMQASHPEKICLSGSGIYFYKAPAIETVCPGK